MCAAGTGWAADHWALAGEAAQAALTKGGGSAYLALLAEALQELSNGAALLDLTPPIVQGPSDRDSFRYGVFHARTDRDAFIEALLGRPVPTHPRYRKEPLVVATEIEARERLRDALGPPFAEFGQQLSGQLGLTARRRVSDAITDLVEDPGLVAALDKILTGDPDAFAASPPGVLLLSALRDDPLWHFPLARLGWEFVTVAPIGPGVFVGTAWWDRSGVEGRRYRRAVAAHLRYLFDHVVSPWNRWPDRTTRREAATLLRRRPGQESISALAARLRTEHGESYAQEEAAKTTRRLYRLNASLRSERTLYEIPES
jgi:hypothetical protein